jgi:hypothetical protein
MSKLYIFLFLFASNLIIAQPSNQKDDSSVPPNTKSFEGTIKYIQNSESDTTYYNYYIKDRKVRIDIVENNQVDNSFLFDLDKQSIIALSASKKLFTGIPCRPFKKNTNTDDLIIIKSMNSKVINGYTCYQWRVKSKSQKTEVAYWVANENFDFFRDLLSLWNRSEKYSNFFLNIPDAKGYFPMLSIERTLLRDEKLRLAVLEIQNKKIDDKLFNIPTNYKAFNQ